MRLVKARIQKYRSIRDSGWFDVEPGKTILVGPNEAGKTALLQALQQINPPAGSPGFDSLRDYPRSEYNDITSGKVKPEEVTIAEAHFMLDDADKEAISEEFRGCAYIRGRKLDNTPWHQLEGGPQLPSYNDLKKDLLRLASHTDNRGKRLPAGKPESPLPSAHLTSLTKDWSPGLRLTGEPAKKLISWLESVLPLVDEDDKAEEGRYDRLHAAATLHELREKTLSALHARLPVLVLFGNYFRVRPLLHLEHLAQRIENNLLDDQYYDYGNKCLLQLLGFTARQLSNLGKAAEPPAGDAAALKAYRDQLDQRSYQLNAASVRLTEEIRKVWVPEREEADRLRVMADAQYLKVVVEDDLGVEIELDQRSEGFSGSSPSLSSSLQKLWESTRTRSSS